MQHLATFCSVLERRWQCELLLDNSIASWILSKLSYWLFPWHRFQFFNWTWGFTSLFSVGYWIVVCFGIFVTPNYQYYIIDWDCLYLSWKIHVKKSFYSQAAVLNLLAHRLEHDWWLQIHLKHLIPKLNIHKSLRCKGLVQTTGWKLMVNEEQFWLWFRKASFSISRIVTRANLVTVRYVSMNQTPNLSLALFWHFVPLGEKNRYPVL